MDSLLRSLCIGVARKSLKAARQISLLFCKMRFPSLGRVWERIWKSKTLRCYVFLNIMFLTYILGWRLQDSIEMKRDVKQLRRAIVWLGMTIGTNFTSPLVKTVDQEFLNSSYIAMWDPLLVDIIRKRFIHPPSMLPYNFKNTKLNEKNSTMNPSKGAVQAIEDLLSTFVMQTDDPFYLDCGASDGEWGSNSIWLERRGWSGLLIEPDPTSFQNLRRKHRKAYTGNFCLSNTRHPRLVNFYQDEREGGLASSLKENNDTFATKPITVQCFPLYSVLLAMERHVVDFLSLDVEGSELEVLATIPFDRVIFKVVTLDTAEIHQGYWSLQRFMSSKGYRHYVDVNQDSIFIHPSVH